MLRSRLWKKKKPIENEREDRGQQRMKRKALLWGPEFNFMFLQMLHIFSSAMINNAIHLRIINDMTERWTKYELVDWGTG